MRRFYYLSAAVMLGVIALAACNSSNNNAGSSNGAVVAKNVPTSSTPNVPSDGVRRVTTVELRDMLAKETAIVIDTRGADAYKGSHIKGSLNMPVDEVAKRFNELPRNKTIVAYCS